MATKLLLEVVELGLTQILPLAQTGLILSLQQQWLLAVAEAVDLVD
jgi:hypothetical protein